MFKKNPCIDTLESISLNFEKMGDNDIFMKQQFVEFDEDHKIKFNFKEWHIAICQNGGLIAACKKKGIFDITKGTKINKYIIVTYQNLRTQFLIPIDWDYKKVWIVDLEFNDKEQLYAICNNGSIFKIDIATKKAVPKPTTNLFENEPIVKAKLFENGFIALTLNGDFYYVPNIKNPTPQLFFAMKSLLEFSNDVDFLLIPSDYTKSKKLELLITNPTGEGIVHIEQNDNGQFYFLPVENSDMLECKGVSIMKKDKLEPYIKNLSEVPEDEFKYTDETRLEKILAMAISPNKEQIALYNNRGYVFFMTPNLDDIESRKRVNVGLNEELTSDELLEQQQIINYEEGCQFLFAGEEAVAICGNRFIILVNESGNSTAFKMVEKEEYNPTKPKIFFHCISEIDGIRCLTNDGIYFISKVCKDLVKICDPFSNSHAKKLIKYYNSSEEIRKLKDKLSDVIFTLQNASAHIYWNKTEDDKEKKELQLFLLKIAQDAKYYVKKDEFNFQRFYLNCKNIRAINNLRNNIRRPRLITYQEYDNIKINDLIKFLVRCLDYETASKLCQYLEVNIQYVYERYAISCIKRIPSNSREDEERVFELLYNKLEDIPDFSFVNISKKAFKHHKDTIGFKFLDKEKSILARLPKYKDKKQYNKIFELCQNIYDNNLLNKIFGKIFEEASDKSEIVKIARKYPKLKQFMTGFLYKNTPDLLDNYIENFNDPEEIFFYSLEQYFQSEKISKRKEYLSMAKENLKLIDININPNFDYKFYKNYLDSLESNLKYKLDFQSYCTDPEKTSFDISIYDSYKMILKDKKNYNIAKSKNSEFGFSQEGLSIVRFYSLAKDGYLETIDELLKNNYNNLKKFSLSVLNMVEIYFIFNQYDKAIKVINLLIDPFYFQYKLDMLKYMKKYEDALEIIISDKNIHVESINDSLREIINLKPTLLQKAKELASKYKVSINIG